MRPAKFALVACLLLFTAAAQEAPEPLWFDADSAGDPLGSFRLTRNQRIILVQQFAPQADGGQFRTNVPNCEAGLRLSTVYAPAPHAVVTDVAETRIIAPLVLSRRPEVEGESSETLTMFGGSVVLDDGLCPAELDRSGLAEVYILQGLTMVSGTELLYDNDTGLADLSGPVRLLRDGGDSGPQIVASAESLVYDVDTELSTLSGEVEISSGERVSYADTLVLDEEAGLATLTGKPARSIEGENEIRGDVLLYYLDTDDVVVQGAVSGTIELELR